MHLMLVSFIHMNLVQFFPPCHSTSQQDYFIVVGLVSENLVTRNRILAGVILLGVALSVVLFTSFFFSRAWKSNQPHVGQRTVLPSLSYCASNQVRPCVESFQLDSDGKMIIHVLAPRSVPAFEIRIRSVQTEKRYPCQREQRSSLQVSCTGEVLPVGEKLQFVIVSLEEDALLAEGRFPIIGIALATPEFAVTPTPVSIFEHLPR